MKLSIIIPVYNVENYLAKCLDSVIHPDLSDYEIIAVDDGSTDSCAAILADYAARYPALIKVISKENGGLGSARNAGMRAASGQYILFVDSDDYLLPEAVGELLAKCDGCWDICFFDFEAVDENGRTLSYGLGADFESELTLQERGNLFMYAPNAWNKLVRRSLYTNHAIVFPDRAWYEDLRTMPKLYLHAEHCCRIAKPFYRYLQRQGSIMNSSSVMRNLETIDAIDDLCDYYKSQGEYLRYKEQFEYLAFYHQYICAIVRVCLADRKSGIADKLRDDFLRKFPSYRESSCVQNTSLKYKLLDRLIRCRMYFAVSLIMGLNTKLK